MSYIGAVAVSWYIIGACFSPSNNITAFTGQEIYGGGYHRILDVMWWKLPL